MRATELHSADETKDAMPKFPPKTQCMAASKLPAPHYHILFSCFEFFRSRPQVHLDQVARNGLPNLQHRWPWEPTPCVLQAFSMSNCTLGWLTDDWPPCVLLNSPLLLSEGRHRQADDDAS